MDVKLNFTAVDNSGALASAASDKLEGVMRVIVLGSKVWMFSSEDINKTIVLKVDAWADNRDDHVAMSKVEDAAWHAIERAVQLFAEAVTRAQQDRLRMVEKDEEREHQRLAKEEAGKIDHYVKKEPVGALPGTEGVPVPEEEKGETEEMFCKVPEGTRECASCGARGEFADCPGDEDLTEAAAPLEKPALANRENGFEMGQKPAKKGRKK